MGISLDEVLLDNSSAIKVQDTNGDELGINADGSIDVNFAAGAKIIITDGTDDMAVNADGSLNAVVSAVDLDIRDLAFATDKVDVSGSSVTVSATDLDVRDLTHVSDSIKIGDGTEFLAVNADGSINVNFSVVTADDDADAGNPLKVGGRAVSGALSAVSASNDRYDLLGDMYRRTWVNTSRNVSLKNSAETVGVAAAQILAVPLSGRREVTIQNEGSQSVYIGSTAGVTTANGIKISKNSSATFEFGEDLDIYMISGSAGQDVRLLESA